MHNQFGLRSRIFKIDYLHIWNVAILDGSRACHFEHWGKGYFFVGRATAGSDGRGGVGASAKVALLMSHQNSSRCYFVIDLLSDLTSGFSRIEYFICWDCRSSYLEFLTS